MKEGQGREEETDIELGYGKNDSLKFILESWFCYLILDSEYYGKIQKS